MGEEIDVYDRTALCEHIYEIFKIAASRTRLVSKSAHIIDSDEQWALVQPLLEDVSHGNVAAVAGTTRPSAVSPSWRPAPVKPLFAWWSHKVFVLSGWMLAVALAEAVRKLDDEGISLWTGHQRLVFILAEFLNFVGMVYFLIKGPRHIRLGQFVEEELECSTW